MKTRYLTYTGLLLALLILCSQIVVPLPPVPITLQTFAVLLIGMVLPPLYALAATGIYALAGLLGLPVFANWSGGPQSFLSPSFGFVISFIVAAWLMAFYLQGKSHRGLVDYILAAIIGTIVIYAIGLPYLAWILNVLLHKGLSLIAILNIGILPFLLGDLFKLVLAILIARRLDAFALYKMQKNA